MNYAEFSFLHYHLDYLTEIVGRSGLNGSVISSKFYIITGVLQLQYIITDNFLIVCSGENWEVCKYSHVCSLHFIGGKPSNMLLHPAYAPSIKTRDDYTPLEEKIALAE